MEKNREPDVNTTATSLKASIDDADLKIFLTAQWVDAPNVGSITNDPLRDCIRDKSIRKIEGDQPHLVDDSVKGVKINEDIADAEDRIWTLQRQYIAALESAGLAEIPESKPHISIEHILRRIKPQALKKRMKNIVQWKEDVQFDKKDFGGFMRELASQAKQLENEYPTIVRSIHVESDDSEDDTGSKGKRLNVQRHKKITQKSSSERVRPRIEPTDNTLGKRKREGSNPPTCLNPACRSKGGQHLLRNCNMTNKELAKRLTSEYRASKKNGGETQSLAPKGSICRLVSKSIKTHSALFNASFSNGTVQFVVLADQGSDTKLISESLFQSIKLGSNNLKSEELDPSNVYVGIEGNGKVNCKLSVKTDVLLKIRHATSLLLRNVT